MSGYPTGIQDLWAMADDHAPLRSRLKAAAWLWVNRQLHTIPLCDLADAADVPLDRLEIEVDKTPIL